MATPIKNLEGVHYTTGRFCWLDYSGCNSWTFVGVVSSIFGLIPDGPNNILVAGGASVLAPAAIDIVSGSRADLDLARIANLFPNRIPTPMLATIATARCMPENRPGKSVTRHHPRIRAKKLVMRTRAAWRVAPVAGAQRRGQSHCSLHAGHVTWIVPDAADLEGSAS